MRRQRPLTGFTLTELLVAVAVVVGLMLMASSILGTTSKVARLGEANTDVLQEAAAIGRQMRTDVASVTTEGVFAIRCVAVPNDINGVVLLNPSLPPKAIIRADQMVFFTNADQGVRTFLPEDGGRNRERARALISRMYYGHAFQIGEAGEPIDTARRAFDVAPDEVVFPWTTGNVNMVRTVYKRTWPQPFDSLDPSTKQIAPSDSRRWVFARQPVVLVDDDLFADGAPEKTLFLNEILSAYSIFLNDPIVGETPQIRDGRIDAAATELKDIRDRITLDTGGGLHDWDEQYDIISSQLLYYPRAERNAPGPDRVDQSLTNHIMGTACGSVVIDWAYRDGTGFVFDGSGTPLEGVTQPNPDTDIHQWFGLEDIGRGVMTYDEYRSDDYGAKTIFSDNLERMYFDDGVAVYEAVFGYNRDTPLDGTGNPNQDLGYTPWPTTLRVTLTLHDSTTLLEGGRDVQFILDLPKSAAK